MPLTTLHIARNRYRIEAIAARSPDGATYRAFDLQRGLPVFLDESVPRPGIDSDTLARRRALLRQRAAVLSEIDHPHLAGVVEAFDEGGADYLATDVVEGEALADLIVRAGAVPESRVLLWAHQLLGALAACHERGVAHGAVSPQAITITPSGDAILGGFAQPVVQDPLARRSPARRGSASRTPDGRSRATPDYSHDLHDLAATLAAALAGQSSARAGRRRLSTPRGEATRSLRAVLMRALASAPEKRWPDARTMAAALPPAGPAGAWPLAGRPQRAETPARRWVRWLWAPAAGVLLLAAAVAWATATQAPETVLVAVTPTALASVPVISSTVRPRDGMAMVYVPAGTFAMGSIYGNRDNRPVHDVTLDAFWIDQTEVTNAQYSWCVAAGACGAIEPFEDPALNDAQHPVAGVTWHDAVDYCTWVGARLLTEAEWEYAARGPEARMYPWGAVRPTGYANCAEDYCADGFASSAPVASFPNGASWVGAVDMAGNVWEWVNDWYEQGYYFASPSVNPTGPEEGATRGLRGGGWGYNAANVRSTRRGSGFPGARSEYLGFRCASDGRP